jgi:hypothetical protein
MGIYRPSQWSNTSMVSITVTPTKQATTMSTDAAGAVTVGATSTTTTTYVFDAVLELDHEQRLEKTHHPIQTGADISSHAYLMPARVVLSIGMSDAMDSYANSAENSVATGEDIITPWEGDSSKSVSAYQTIIGIQAARQPVTVTTRLRTYTNMLIASVAPHEDHRTITGLRMRVEFEEIFTATVTTTPVSSRSNDTDSTGLGTVSTTSPSAAVEKQFNVSNANPAITSVDVPGAGAFSSVNISSLETMLKKAKFF